MKNPEIQNLIEIASKIYKCDPLDKTRAQVNSWSRMAITNYIKKHFKSKDICLFFDKDRTTINHYFRKHKISMEYDKTYRELYESFTLEIEKYENKENFAYIKIKKSVNDLNFELLELGLKMEQIIEFWNNEINKKNE